MEQRWGTGCTALSMVPHHPKRSSVTLSCSDMPPFAGWISARHGVHVSRFGGSRPRLPPQGGYNAVALYVQSLRELIFFRGVPARRRRIPVWGSLRRRAPGKPRVPGACGDWRYSLFRGRDSAPWGRWCLCSRAGGPSFKRYKGPGPGGNTARPADRPRHGGRIFRFLT